MDPVRTLAGDLLLAGLKVALPPRSRVQERVRAIQDVARALAARAAELPGRVGAERYSVITNDVHEDPYAQELGADAEPTYYAMIAVESFAALPKWAERYTVRAGRWAVFEHIGPPRDLVKTVATIQRDWMPKIPGLFEREIELFIYPPGYDPTSAEARFEYWLPLP